MRTSSRPFIDLETGRSDVDQILAETFPLVRLVASFVGLALLPFVVVFLVAGSSPLGLLLTVVSQFVLAVGTGIVPMYVVARGIQLAGDRERRR